MNTSGTPTGYGIEMEGHFLNDRGDAVPLLRGVSTAWVVAEHLKRKLPELLPSVSFEEASTMLEVKTEVKPDIETGLREVFEKQQLINDLISFFDIRLAFVGVVPGDPGAFVPASTAPNSRAAQLEREWGQERMQLTKIAGLQINDSRIFENTKTDDERYELTRRLYNNFSSLDLQQKRRMIPARDSNGMTRMHILQELMHGAKGNNFLKRGYTLEEILHPPHFHTVEAMQRWMAAHSDKDRYLSENSKLIDKNTHSATIKLKRYPWLIETRGFDAQDSLPEAMELVALYRDLLYGITV